MSAPNNLGIPNGGVSAHNDAPIQYWDSCGSCRISALVPTRHDIVRYEKNLEAGPTRQQSGRSQVCPVPTRFQMRKVRYRPRFMSGTRDLPRLSLVKWDITLFELNLNRCPFQFMTHLIDTCRVTISPQSELCGWQLQYWLGAVGSASQSTPATLP